MARTSPSGTASTDSGSSYWDASRKPLQILAFLAPLILAYELGLAMFLRSRDGVLTNKAHETLLLFFDTFGLTATGGLYLGGAAIIVVLIIWHLLARDPWRIDPATPALMAAESLGRPLNVKVRWLGQDDIRRAVGSGRFCNADGGQVGFANFNDNARRLYTAYKRTHGLWWVQFDCGAKYFVLSHFQQH